MPLLTDVLVGTLIAALAATSSLARLVGGGRGYDEDTMRSPVVSGTALVVLAAAAAAGLKAIGTEPYSPVWLGALIVVMVLASLTDPVRFGWREPDERRRSQ